jgi:glycosyltransferase involved in cell wall biosynthesis
MKWAESVLMMLSVILPVYNERKYFEKILKRVLAVKLPIKREIIIIESNSTDGTREIVKRYEGFPGVRVIYEDRPRGKGSAVKKGLKAAKGDIILIQDSDLEYDPQDYPKLLEPILADKAKFVIGSRKMSHDGWQIRKMRKNRLVSGLINVLANLADAFFNVLYGVHLTDPQSMYKVFKRACLKGIRFRSNYFDLDWEMCAKFIRRGYVPLEIPIRYDSRSFGEGKKVRLLRDIFLNVYAIVRYRF